MKNYVVLLGLFITISLLLFTNTLFAAGNSIPCDGSKGLQFTSSGHVLLFDKSGMTVASSNHAMKVLFLHANTVSPKAEMPVTQDAFADKGTMPLNKVTYSNLWKGVTLIYTMTGNGIFESSYYLTPTQDGIDASRIRLGSNRSLSLDNSGNLVVSYPTGTLTESAPIAWQIIQGTKKPVSVAYRLYGKNEVGFTLGKYVSGVPIMIDPTLSWNTFLGGTGSDMVKGIATDKNGNIYVCGTSFATWGSPILPFAGSSDPFVAKLTSSGSLLWSTFLGGTSTVNGSCIAVDSSGVIYVGGNSYASWGTNIIQPFVSSSSSTEGFIAKLTTNGTLLWNTFLGAGSGYNYLNGIALDSKDTLYVTGYSTSSWGTPIATFTTATYGGYIAKLDSSGGLKWKTFFGPTADTNSYAFSNTIAIDNQDTIYVGGNCNATWGSPKQAFTGTYDGYVAQFDRNGKLIWNTFLGGTSSSYVYGIAVEAVGTIDVNGYSDVTWGNPIRAFTVSSTNTDAFVAKLTYGNLAWNTFLGGSGSDRVNSNNIAIDGSHNVYISGSSSAAWGAPIRAFQGGTNDAFAATLTSAGSLSWLTFLGGSGSDQASSIAIDSSGYVYVGGQSNAAWGGGDTSLRAYISGNDGFVTKLLNTGGLLPVELTTFTATAANNSSTLSWETATETNNYGFEVERRAVSDKQVAVSGWSKIGFVAGNGTSSSTHRYAYTDANVLSGTYAYRLKQSDNSGTYNYSSEAEVTVAAPTVFALNQNYPNPFNPTTTIRYDLPKQSDVKIVVYDVIGREVATLVNETKEAGSSQTVWSASRFASGVYFYRIQANNYNAVKKFVLMK